jgi:hypothetical protein
MSTQDNRGDIQSELPVLFAVGFWLNRDRALKAASATPRAGANWYTRKPLSRIAMRMHRHSRVARQESEGARAGRDRPGSVADVP